MARYLTGIAHVVGYPGALLSISVAAGGAAFLLVARRLRPHREYLGMTGSGWRGALWEHISVLGKQGNVRSLQEPAERAINPAG